MPLQRSEKHPHLSSVQYFSAADFIMQYYFCKTKYFLLKMDSLNVMQQKLAN